SLRILRESGRAKAQGERALDDQDWSCPHIDPLAWLVISCPELERTPGPRCSAALDGLVEAGHQPRMVRRGK
ncbi:MAG: hypothetical protein ACXW3M_06340, partial [Rhodoplanes sp.]